MKGRLLKRKRVAVDSSQDFSRASGWGVIRFGILVAFPLLWMVADYLFYRFIYQQYRMENFGQMPQSGGRYLGFPVVVLALALLTGARYIQHAYGLSSAKNAFNYLASALFIGLGGLPVIFVNGGKVVLDEDEENLAHIIGGPAFVNVFPGNVVLLECLDGSVRAVGGGTHYMSRLETIKETLYLEDRSAKVEKITATSKDGIVVEAHDIQYRYRLAATSGAKDLVRRTPTDPYPFSEEAVKAMTYNRNITDRGVAPWHTGVNGLVDSTISDYIRSHRVDQLLAPANGEDDPRDQIYEKFKSPDSVAQFRSRGAELLWIGIGHFEAPEPQVGEQRVNNWQTRWVGSAQRDRTVGEAQRVALQEQGRADAQAHLLRNILSILEDAKGQSFTTPELKAAYLARITQYIKTMQKELLSSVDSKSDKFKK